MDLKDKLQFLRKQNGYSQEQLADKLGIARQTISKWENGQAIPELSGLIALSELYGVTIDRIVKDNDACNIPLCRNTSLNMDEIIAFLLEAKKNTYADVNSSYKAKSCRTGSHDFCYRDDSGYTAPPLSRPRNLLQGRLSLPL